MGRLKNRISARLFSCGMRWSIDSTPPRHVVTLTAEVDNDPGRFVDLTFDPDHAESLGRTLIKFAAKVRTMSKGMSDDD